MLRPIRKNTPTSKGPHVPSAPPPPGMEDVYVIADGNVAVSGVRQYFLAIPIERLGRKLRDGDYVHLERYHRPPGGPRLTNTVVREVKMRRGRVEYHPLAGRPASKIAAKTEVMGIVVVHQVWYPL